MVAGALISGVHTASSLSASAGPVKVKQLPGAAVVVDHLGPPSFEKGA